jgi:hypothetical protein
MPSLAVLLEASQAAGFKDLEAGSLGMCAVVETDKKKDKPNENDPEGILKSELKKAAANASKEEGKEDQGVDQPLARLVCVGPTCVLGLLCVCTLVYWVHKSATKSEGG